MAHRSKLVALLVLLLTSYCSAQGASGLYIAKLVLFEQSVNSSNINCERTDDSLQPASVAVQIYGNFTRKCYNIAETFSISSYDNATLEYRSDGTIDTCNPDWRTGEANCTSQIQATALNQYSPAANYSKVKVDILYGLYLANTLETFEARVFAGEACEENPAASEPWFSWGGCYEEMSQGSCREVPYSVKSFTLDRIRPNETGCMIAAERGTGVQLSKAGFAAVAVGLMLAGLMALV